MDSYDGRNEVLHLLTQVSMQNPEILKQAEEKLRHYESIPGFHSILMIIVLDHNIDLKARWQAVIYIKNGIDRYWRKKIPCSIQDEERVNLKQKLLCNYNEPVNQIATQLAVVIAKIARFDCPHHWPELLPSILNSAKSDDDVIQHRALLILNQVIKSLASKRLAGDRHLFQEISTNIFNFVLSLWNGHTESFFQQASHGNNCENSSLIKALLSLKILRKLVVDGFKEPHKVGDVDLFLSVTFERMKLMLDCRQRFLNNQLNVTIEKYIILLTKVLTDTLDHHPFSFIKLIGPTLQFTFIHVIQCKNDGLLFERFVVPCLNLIKGILLCAEYRPAKTFEETRNPATIEAHMIKNEFFTPTVLMEICHRLISHYFLLTNDDLQMWEEDPEAFAIEEKGESWKYNLRVCTEVLFVSIFHEFRESLTPFLLDLMHENEAATRILDPVRLLHREAVYNVIGLSAFDLFDEVDFDQWFISSLIKELTCKAPGYKIIRRRVIWLVGQWVSVKLSSDLRPTLYESILPLLRSEEDLVVRMTTTETLKISVDDFEFNTEQFLPYLESSFGLLFQLLKQVSGSDAKMHVLHVLSFIVERVGCAIRPHAPELAHYLPLLWDESAEHNMLRCAILSALVHLVEGMGSLSEQLYPFMVPVIRLSTDVTQDPHVYLLEDGLELWLALLENASSLSRDMLHLFPNILPLLEFGSESLRTCFHIISAYLIIAPLDIKKSMLPNIMESCRLLVLDLRAEGIILIMRLLESILKVFPSDGPQICQPVLPYVYRSIIEGQEYPMVMSMYLSVVARTIINDQNCVFHVLNGLAQQSNKAPEILFGSLLDTWLDRLTLVTHMERRKMLGLALSCLIVNPASVISDRFCGIVLGVVEVLHDIVRKDDNGAQVDSLMLTESDIVYEDNENEHSKRKKQLSLMDPVHCVELRGYLRTQLQQLQATLGQAAFEELLQTVDVETMQQMKEYV